MWLWEKKHIRRGDISPKQVRLLSRSWRNSFSPSSLYSLSLSLSLFRSYFFKICLSRSLSFFVALISVATSHQGRIHHGNLMAGLCQPPKSKVGMLFTHHLYFFILDVFLFLCFFSFFFLCSHTRTSPHRRLPALTPGRRLCK